MKKDYLIEVKKLEKTFYTGGVETRAVRGVDFKIKKGEFLTIMGPSGSGKSTIMQILGFLDRPTGGNYYFKGQNSKKFSDDKLARLRNREVGFIFQTFNLLSRTTVFENVELPLLYSAQKRNKKQIEKMVEKALKKVSMNYRSAYFSNQLSGGEKQRAAIARALVNEPEIIFADEPTGNLDSKSGKQVMKILQDLNRQGKTVVLITHETKTARHAKRIIKIIDGKIQDDYPVKKSIDANGKGDLK
ncbi:MAG: ATP-binding cassette domain-containing protein [Candidatus Moranbacteria bacterium]|nr:ATP-binding cassette domain-containing protein [Candidatus Moranbacteria bacterium]